MESKGRNPHPKKDDPLEQRIRGLIAKEVYSTPLGKQMFEEVNRLQLEYFRNSLLSLNNPNLIHDATQALLRRLAEVTNSRVVEGEEKLSMLSKGSPTFAILNHFSAYKLVTIQDSDLGLNFPDNHEIYPFPIFFSSLSPVAEKLGDNLYDAHLELPGPLVQIQESAGLLVVPAENGAFGSIKERTSKVVTRQPNSLIVIFPEGGTSGKRNMGGPYDLDKFHGGSFAIAEELGIQVLPVCQYFNPQSGFEIGILDPLSFSAPPQTNVEDRKEYFRNVAETTRGNMQFWLNSRIAATQSKK